MKVIVKPSDLVKRCLWDKYTYYVVGNAKDAEKILEEDIEFEISEKDAIVIDLLKCMETDNLIHKFNEHMIHMLSVKSTKHNAALFIKKKTVETTIENFVDKFPTYWKMPLNYARGYDDLLQYISDLQTTMIDLEIHMVPYQNSEYETYSSSAVKKKLSFKHY